MGVPSSFHNYVLLPCDIPALALFGQLRPSLASCGLLSCVLVSGKAHWNRPFIILLLVRQLSGAFGSRFPKKISGISIPARRIGGAAGYMTWTGVHPTDPGAADVLVGITAAYLDK